LRIFFHLALVARVGRAGGTKNHFVSRSQIVQNSRIFCPPDGDINFPPAFRREDKERYVDLQSVLSSREDKTYAGLTPCLILLCTLITSIS
jgi:hypothetical protein